MSVGRSIVERTLIGLALVVSWQPKPSPIAPDRSYRPRVHLMITSCHGMK